MCSVVGLLGNDTMKVTGKIDGEEVIILIDSRASHNFISFEVVSKLKLPTEKTQENEVSMGDRYQVKGNKLCNGVELEIQGMQVQQSFYLIDLGGANLVLGIEWLKELGEVKMNWNLTMKVKEGNKEWCIKGDPTLSKTLVSLKSMMHILKKGEQGFLL